MERDSQLIAKISAQLNRALKAYASKLSDDFGIPVSASAAARRLITEGLERAGFPVEPPDPNKPQPKRGRPPKKKPVHALAGRPTAFQQRRAAKRAEKEAAQTATKATPTKRAK